jgi:hypothetical protein
MYPAQCGFVAALVGFSGAQAQLPEELSSSVLPRRELLSQFWE